MIVLPFVALYLVCASLLIAVMWQDRRRHGRRPEASARGPQARDPRATHVSDRVFSTHV
jgi:uncharacterized iron-regulated membrane protein